MQLNAWKSVKYRSFRLPMGRLSAVFVVEGQIVVRLSLQKN
jgi:hypothetical protein